MSNQNPQGPSNLHQWQLLQAAPKERRMFIASEFETIYGEAPSGAHEAEPRWVIWRELQDESGRITKEYAQDGINTLYWIYNSIAFEPVPNADGTPYNINLDNECVFDGMGAGLPVANITVDDIDDSSHSLILVNDPFSKFTISGNVLVLAGTVQLVDIAYPIRIRAIDDDGKSYDQVFSITVKDPTPPIAGDFTGELNIFEEVDIVMDTTETVLEYTVPVARALRIRLIDVFGDNIGSFTVEVDSVVVARKDTYYTYYETDFPFENFSITAGQVIKITAKNKGCDTAKFNVRLRGYQYAE